MAIVLVGAFGIFVLSAVSSLFEPGPAPSISEPLLESLLLYESVVLAVLCAFLYLRDWNAQRIGLKPAALDTLIGIALAAATYAAYLAIWLLVSAAGLQPTTLGGTQSQVAGSLALPAVIAFGLLNPLFEELFVCGYVITLAREKGRLSLGVNASIAIRLIYHLNQGGMGVIGIIPFGLICAVWYARTARLWPVIVAHAMIDLTGLLEFVH